MMETIQLIRLKFFESARELFSHRYHSALNIPVWSRPAWLSLPFLRIFGGWIFVSLKEKGMKIKSWGSAQTATQLVSKTTHFLPKDVNKKKMVEERGLLLSIHENLDLFRPWGADVIFLPLSSWIQYIFKDRGLKTNRVAVWASPHEIMITISD